MGLLDDLRGLLEPYASGTASSAQAGTDFPAVARSVDSGTLADGIAAAMRSDATAPFPQLIAQLFSAGSSDQRMATVNGLLSSMTPDVRAKLLAQIPALGSISASDGASSAAALSAADVQTVAEHAEQHDASVVDRMSALYAAHPTLVRTLGTAAMVIAMRNIAERYGSHT